MDNINFNLNEAFREVVNRMESEGAFDHAAFVNIIDEVLEEKIANAELDPDSNIKQYAESLQLMWPQAEALITKTGDNTLTTDTGEELPEGFSVEQDS